MTSAHAVKDIAGIILSNELSEKQVIVALGPNASLGHKDGFEPLKVGDWVTINTDRFPRNSKPGKQDMGNVVTVIPPIEKVDGESYLFFTDREIKYRLKK
tara:strand:+ start:28554 stop:28853 length:300 start_codon:yes stop_codon:yes gene_type:complete